MPTEDFMRASAPPLQALIERTIAYAAESIQPPADRNNFLQALRRIGDSAADIPSAVLALRAALDILGDGHSRIVTNDEAQDAEPIWPAGEIQDGIALLTLPSYAGDGGLSMAFAARGQQVIQALDAQAPSGWVIDLRGNAGGDIFAMLAALGPFFTAAVDDPGTLGFFNLRQGTERFGYRDGAAWVENDIGRDVRSKIPRKQLPYDLRDPAPVAVLVGPETASAAEIAAIALRGMGPCVRLFGAATKGQATLLRLVPDLPTDAVQIELAVGTLADRTGRVYGRSLSPDVATADAQPMPAVMREWLAEATLAGTLQTPSNVRQNDLKP